MKENQEHIEHIKCQKQIKITVLIPFYNRIDSTVRAIKSVLNQTYKNLEIILIDDGSDDEIGKLLEIVKNDSRIAYYRIDENSGPAAARNLGISMAKGEYIAFLDSDDEFLPDKLEAQLKQMIINSSIISHTSYIRRMNGKKTVINSGKLNGAVARDLIRCCPIATPTVMINRAKLENKRFNNRFRVGEDICLWLDLLTNDTILGISEPYTIVNVSTTSTSKDPGKQLRGLINILSFVLAHPQLCQYDSEIVWLCHSIGRYLKNNSAINTSFQNNSLYSAGRTVGMQGIVEIMRKCIPRSWKTRIKNLLGQIHSVFYKQNREKTSCSQTSAC